MAATSEKDKVISNLRACLISSPSGATVADLNKDYKSLVGEYIPFKRLGYPTLEDFLQCLPNVNVVNKGGQWHVLAKATETSKHISKLVQDQKKPSKKPRKANKHTLHRYNRPSVSRFSAPSNQIPHFMQGPSSRKASAPKPKAQYITPDRLPVKTYPSRASVTTYQSNGTKPTQNYRAPEDLPVTVYPTSGSKPSQPAPSKPDYQEPPRPSRVSPPPQPSPSMSATCPAFLPIPTRQSALLPTPAKQSALLPTPAKQSALLPTPAKQSALLPTPAKQSALLPTPAKQQSTSFPTLATQRALLPTPSTPPIPTLRAPSEPSKPSQKPPRSSVADRLNVYKKNTSLTSISEVRGLNNESKHNGHDSTPVSYCEAVTQAANNVPSIFPYEVKVCDPISWNKDRNKVQTSSSKTFKNVDVQPYHYDDRSYIFKLSRYAEQHNWPKPDFFVLNRRVGNPKSPENKYICRVSINCTPVESHTSSTSQTVPCHEFSSYPKEFPDVNSAMSYVAQKAYEALIEKDTIQLPETKDIQIILGRISEMVKGKDQGVWLYQIEKMYKAQFNECLPRDLPTMMDQCPTLEISKLAESYYIVRPKHQEAETTKYFSPNYVSHLTVNKLSYPNDEMWDVFVSKVKSLNEIYVRIIGEQYSTLYENLAAEMDAYYVNQETDRPEFIEVGKYYALVTQDSCFRVLVTSSIENEYQVYLIDVGDVDFVEPETLRVLLPKFYVVASQAVPCFLDGMHNYDFALNNPDINDEIYEMVLGKSFASLLSNRDPIHLTLYDTDSNEDININAALKRLIDDNFTYPDLFEEGILKEIQVMTVDGNGQVYIQIPSWTLNCLNEKIALIGNGYYEVSYVKDPQSVSAEKVYYWCHGPTRVKVLDVHMNGELDVDFIDSGGQKTVHFSELYEIEQLDDIMPKIPPQAVPVLLHDVNDGLLKAHQVQKFLDMVNCNSESPTIGKVVSFCDGMAQIEIFVRNEASQLLVSVNSNLSLSVETITDQVSNMPIDQCSVSSTVSNFSHADGIFLKGSIIPKIGDDLDIYVTGIANPLNFTVTPVKYLKYLNNLAEEMIIFYSSTSSKEIYRPSVGECVAAQSDGCWFRVQIDKKLDSNFYSGKYVDHGHMDVFPVKSIRGLPNKFKKLPHLAFRAQLHGIKPMNGDWNVDDCLAVRAMIHNKKFYSKVRDILTDADGKKLSLEIVDTSTENDVYISRQLVMESRAQPDLP